MNRSRECVAGANTPGRFVAPMFVISTALIGCGGDRPLDISGRWESLIDRSVLSIEPSGLFAMDVPGERMPIVGTVTIEGTVATFRNRPETQLCVDDDGVYEVAISDDLLTATLMRDTCPMRVLQMSRPWKRLQARQSPSSTGD